MEDGTMNEPLLPTTPSATDALGNDNEPVSVMMVEPATSAAPTPKDDSPAFEADTEAAAVASEEFQEAPQSIHGEEQPTMYRDKYFAIVFLLHLLAVFITAIVLGPKALMWFSSDDDSADNNNNSTRNSLSSGGNVVGEADENGDDTNGDNDNVDVTALWILLTLTPIMAMLITAGVLKVLVRSSHEIVTLSFFAVPLSWLVTFVFYGAIGAATGEDGDKIPGGIFLLMAIFTSLSSLLVYLCFRRYIPFAASNLKVALSAIQVNKGLFFVSLATTLVTYGWFIVWFLAVLGVYYQAQQGGKVPCYDSGNDAQDMCYPQPNPLILILLLLSFYWTHQVLMNILHTTTAGTVGSWWFTPIGSPSMCSLDVWDSFVRATTYSLGSICFGSLVVAVLRVLEGLTQNRQDQNGRGGGGCGGLFCCVVNCLLQCLRSWMEYMNLWAFCYVGLYGYDFMTSGKKVMTLFQYRGWTTIITDRLVFRVLGLMNFSIGILSGCAAVVSDAVFGPVLPDSPGTSQVVVFFVGLIFGIIIASTALFVVDSAVRTIIVCFAESPAELAEHRPGLYSDMRRGWIKVYPDAFHRPPQTQQQSQGDEVPEATLITSN